jgi:ribosomal-protein-alanine N-acetyltransferase
MIKNIILNKVGEITFRPMLFSDVPNVYTVEKQCYEFPWTEKLILDCVAVGYYCWVVEHNNTVIGYAIYRLAVGEAHLFNIAISPKFQNKGLCRAFLGFLLEQMQVKASRVILEVRVSNAPARKIYADFNFKEIGIRKGYYPANGNTKEDALNLELVFDKSN